VNELALFAGAGGGILGGHLLGWRTVCAVEWEQYPASVLCARQNDKILPPFPIWDDVQTFDGRPWRGIVQVVSGGFRARTSAQQDEEQELTENDQVCGNTWQGSLARLDPNTSLWRTAQCSLLEDLELSLQTFPRWGLMQNGALYQLPILVQTISVKEFGSEPNNETFFHTPNTMGLDGGSNNRKALKKKMWLTPRVVEIDESPENFRRRMNSKRQNDRKNGFGSLTMQVKWPTPMSSEHKANRQIRGNHQNGLTSAVLTEEIKKWPTPRTKGMCGGTGSWDLLNKNTTIQEARQMGAGNGGQLNPTWVEWLMGWPPGWTDLKPLEMDKSLYVQQQLGNS